MGANAERKNFRFACNPPITNPLIEKISVAIKLRRIIFTTCPCCSVVKPGAIPISDVTIGRANIAIKIANINETTKARLAIDEKTLQDASRLSF